MPFLVLAYACEPDEGSEPGVGWSWSRMLATIDMTYVVTRSNNAPSIEAALETLPAKERPHFIYVDLPAWARFWKKGARGLRLYYVLWQIAAFWRVRRLPARVGSTIWHLTLANAGLGSTAALLGRPFIYGPVGGGVAPAWRLSSVLGVKGTIAEVARSLFRWTARYVNPLARLAWARADLILVQNEETKKWLPRKHRSKAVILPNAVLAVAEPSPRLRRPDERKILFAGRLLPWKGGVLLARSLRSLPGWRLVVCGSGPDLGRMMRVARRFGVQDRIDFRGRIARSDLLSVMRDEIDVLAVPSLREDAGLVVVEAAAQGVPTVSLDRGGPRALGARVVPISSRDATAAAFARAIQEEAGGDPALPPTVPGASYWRERVVSLMPAGAVDDLRSSLVGPTERRT